MSKFKIGDWWDIGDYPEGQDAAIKLAVISLSTDGWDIENYLVDNKFKPDAEWRYIGIRPDINEVGVFDYISDYDFNIAGKQCNWSEFEATEQPEQECPYCIIEELECKVESLEELISEQAARIRELEADYIQEQAECYLRLNSLLQKHESFQESGKCRSDELADTIEVLQDAYDRLPNRFR